MHQDVALLHTRVLSMEFVMPVSVQNSETNARKLCFSQFNVNESKQRPELAKRVKQQTE